MRILTTYILPLILPTLFWILWLVWRQRKAAKIGKQPPGWDSIPWVWLYIAGGGLAIIVLIGGFLTSDYSHGTYRPTYVDENGTIVRGRVEPLEK